MSGVDETGPDQALARRLMDEDIGTAHDRHDEQQPQCGFGLLGLCCRHCYMGPCRIDPFGDGPQAGVCGAGAETIAARGFLRHIAAGTAAHCEHGRDVAETFVLAARGDAPGYGIRDDPELLELARDLGVAVQKRSMREVAIDVGYVVREVARQIEKVGPLIE